MRQLLIFPLLAAAAPARAHVGHLGEVAGHDHWVAGIAIGAAVAVGIWGALKGGKATRADDTPIETEGEGETTTDEAEA